jgi:hypothetical protein
MTPALAFDPCSDAPCAPPGPPLCYADFRCQLNTWRDNENSISARGGLGDALRLHQQRQSESAREDDRGRTTGLADNGGLSRRQPAAVQLRP